MTQPHTYHLFISKYNCLVILSGEDGWLDKWAECQS